MALPGFAPSASNETYLIDFVNIQGFANNNANTNFFEQFEGFDLDSIRPETNPGLSGLEVAASIGSRFSYLNIHGFRMKRDLSDRELRQQRLL